LHFANLGQFLVVVVAELFLPGEIILAGYLFSLKILDNVTRVHISCNEGHNNTALQVGQVRSHMNCQLLNLSIVAVEPGLESKAVLLHLVDGERGVCAPLDLGYRSDNLSRLLENPVFASVVRVDLVAFLQLSVDRLLHSLSQIKQPYFDWLSRGFDWLREFDDFFLFGEHLGNVLIFELKGNDAVEESLQVQRDHVFVLRIGEDLD